jgi:integrase
LSRDIVVVMARRSYGTGQLFVRADSSGRETWYGSWRVGGRRVKRRVGLKRRRSTSDGLTRTQAEAELRRLMGTEVVLAGPARKTIEKAGRLYVEHLEHVMERKRTTTAATSASTSSRSSVRRRWTRSTGRSSRTTCWREGLSSKTVCNHLNFLHGLWLFAIKREWALKNPVALVDRPRMPRFKERRIQFLRREELDAVV